MDVVKVSLEALLQRATNPQNQNIDTAAVEAFCTLINREREGPLIGVKLLAARIHSKHEQEVLQALYILDHCMQKCGTNFQSEVGKFRFLNEMIKLVSPKYLGCCTPPSVRQKVLELMCLWTMDYPKETKIKEAYDMLKKQGVIKEVPLSVNAEKCNLPDTRVNTIFQDEEKSKLLKKLLKSKNPEDLQAANRLIKTMVKEDERKAELKSKRISELESVQNNVRLLNEMLDSYKPGLSSQDEHELIKELQESCERLRPNVVKLASETQQNEEILGEILKMNDELGQVFDKFNKVIKQPIENDIKEQKSLLDLSGGVNISLENPTPSSYKYESNVDSLCDILTSPNLNSLSITDSDILKPTSVRNCEMLLDAMGKSSGSNIKQKGLDDLDALGEHLLKENLQSAARSGPQFNKLPEKVPMNALTKPQVSMESESDLQNLLTIQKDSAFNFDLTSLLDTSKSSAALESKADSNIDDLLVDITEDIHMLEKEVEKTDDVAEKKELKLGDLFVDLKNIKPSNVKPIVAFEDKSDVNVTFHFAKDKPHEDVTVVVVTIISKNELPIRNVLFRAIVPKACKVKLQSASATDLPAYNPFLPPAAITQILLIANPEKVQVSLKFIVSYNVDDEMMTEMGEIDEMPCIL